MPDSYCWDENRQMLTFSQHQIPGIETLGHSVNSRADSPLEKHMHKDSMEIVLLMKGSQFYTVGTQTYSLSGGDAFITFPDEEHSTGGEPQNVSEFYWIQLNLSVEENFLGLSGEYGACLRERLRNMRQRAFRCRESIRSWFADGFFAAASDDRCVREYGRSLLVSFLYGIVLQERSVQLALSDEIAAAVSYIRQSIGEQIALETLADCAGLSLSRFKARFKKEIGSSPREYINQLKIMEAKQRLRSGMSVNDTALSLGFSSGSYFSVVFKKMTLLSPGEYARNAAGQET
ncbi:MAG: helix-turn-helix domain-containing protein [Hominenteromicrobium sp.]